MDRTASVTAAQAGTIDIGGDLTVNRLGYGAMRITGPGVWGDPPDREQAKRVLRRALELDVNFIDTADSYGPEVSETLIAEALRPYPEDLVIATKGGLVRTGPNRWPVDGRPEHLREACEGSLRRLETRSDPPLPISPTRSLGAHRGLHRCPRGDEGRGQDPPHRGLQRTEPELRRAQALTPVVSVQNRYNVTDRKSESMVDLCEQERMVFLPWAPILEIERQHRGRRHREPSRRNDRQVVLAWLLARSPSMLPIPGTGSSATSRRTSAPLASR